MAATPDVDLRVLRLIRLKLPLNGPSPAFLLSPDAGHAAIHVSSSHPVNPTFDPDSRDAQAAVMAKEI
jgi:hypothetical protein